MKNNLITGQFQLRTPFSRPERIRLRELPLYSFTNLIKKSNLFSFFFNKQWFICPLPQPQRSVMWASYLKKPLKLNKMRQESYFLELNTSFAKLSSFLLFSVIIDVYEEMATTLWWTSIISRECIKTESTRKLSNFNFQWTKTLYQNNLNNITFVFTLFKGYRCN